MYVERGRRRDEKENEKKVYGKKGNGNEKEMKRRKGRGGEGEGIC